ncbi:MAG: type II toxin-antitoxin system HicB family antitoxin, partial [Chlorobiaceae bacterium]
EGIEDLVSFEGDSVIELKKAFEEAVDDYLEICKENGKKTDKSYKGSFNVRIAPDIHKKATRLALMKGMSLNQFIQKAVEEEVIRESINV